MLLLHIISATLFTLSSIAALMRPRKSLRGVVIATGLTTLTSGSILLFTTNSSLGATCARAAVLLAVIFVLAKANKSLQIENA